MTKKDELKVVPIEKSVFELVLHETTEITNSVGGKVEITRVPGGWVYCFEYPGFRQSPVVFIPLSDK